MKIGAHVSTSGGIATGFDRALAIGAECLQIFESAPQQCGTAGYDLSSAEGVDTVIDELEKEIGVKNVAAIHCNDSKAPLGAGRDLHENIGEGNIGDAGFEALLGRKELRDIPFLLEVPGYKLDGAGKGP